MNADITNVEAKQV